METKTASEIMIETFSSIEKGIMAYVYYVVLNWFIFDMIEDKTDYYDHNLPELNLTMRI